MSFTEEKNDKWIALFVNSEEKPFKEIPLDIYDCEVEEKFNPNKWYFYRLYEVYYSKENVQLYKVLMWKSIEVPFKYREALKAICDLSKSAKAYLKEE